MLTNDGGKRSKKSVAPLDLDNEFSVKGKKMRIVTPEEYMKNAPLGQTSISVPEKINAKK